MKRILLFCVTAAFAASAIQAADAGQPPDRRRAVAMMAALFHHDAAKPGGPSAPAPILKARDNDRAQREKFARLLAYEGGYHSVEVGKLFGTPDDGVRRVDRLVSQLDKADPRSGSPWDTTGRVSLSAKGPTAAVPAAPKAKETPGTLSYLPFLALAYAAFPEDGERAAARLAALKDDEFRAEPAARVAFRLLAEAVAGATDKDVVLRTAARAAGDEEVEKAVLAARMKDWKYLRSEESSLGRLERAVFVWYRSQDGADAMGEAARRLEAEETREFAAALSAAFYGLNSVPPEVLDRAAGDKGLSELSAELFQLGTGAIVRRVQPPDTAMRGQ